MSSQNQVWFNIRSLLAVELQISESECTDELVLKTVTGWARQSTFRGSPQIIEEVAEDAVSILSAVVCQFRPGGSFKSWCQRVFRNQVIDRARKAARERMEPLGDYDPAESCIADADQAVRFRFLMSRVQKIIEQLDRAWPHAGAVDLFAVLLMELRLTLAARVAAAFRMDVELLTLQGGLQGYVEQVLPWTEKQQNRSFKPGFPNLEACWQACCAYWEDTQDDSDDRRISTIDRGTFCRLVSELQEDGPDLSTDCWYQWVRRSKIVARQQLGPVEWERYFAPFMPDHRR
jgi:DNA-directed RNA polymerase specialized sigma24 family protein